MIETQITKRNTFETQNVTSEVLYLDEKFFTFSLTLLPIYYFVLHIFF